MMPLAQLLAGAMVASALIRWGATIAVAGPSSLAQAVPMARLRWAQYSSLRWTGWRPALAGFGALLLVQLSFDVYADGGAGAARVLAWTALAVIATIATYACPPAVLFLGSSEPGTYSSFRYLADAHPWLAVAALKESDMRATEFQDTRRSITSRLIPRELRRAIARLAPPPLSSLRSSDPVWEGVVTRALHLSKRIYEIGEAHLAALTLDLREQWDAHHHHHHHQGGDKDAPPSPSPPPFPVEMSRAREEEIRRDAEARGGPRTAASSSWRGRRP
jgi:hypothetical protein